MALYGLLIIIGLLVGYAVYTLLLQQLMARRIKSRRKLFFILSYLLALAIFAGIIWPFASWVETYDDKEDTGLKFALFIIGAFAPVLSILLLKSTLFKKSSSVH